VFASKHGSHVTCCTDSCQNWYTRLHKLFHIRKVGGVTRQCKHLTATPCVRSCYMCQKTTLRMWRWVEWWQVYSCSRHHWLTGGVLSTGW